VEADRLLHITATVAVFQAQIRIFNMKEDAMHNISSNKPYRLATLTAALALILAAPAFADNQYRSASDPKAPTMADPKGNLTQVPGRYSEKFDQADSNRDGMLDRAEYQALQQRLESQRNPLASATPGLMSQRVKDVKGMAVNNQIGEKIGKIKALVVSRHDNNIYAVISIGGFLGIGDTEITMPLDQLAWHEDKLTAPTTASKKELKARPESEKIVYLKLSDNQIIGELGGPGSGESSRTALSFDVLDTNRDDQIDRSDFPP
jgi:hypothetical protein